MSNASAVLVIHVALIVKTKKSKCKLLAKRELFLSGFKMCCGDPEIESIHEYLAMNFISAAPRLKRYAYELHEIYSDLRYISFCYLFN